MANEAQERTQKIREKALELGFQKAGVCPAEAPSKLALLADWLERGNHGTMQWMQRTREKRLDIGKLLPGVRSVVVLGMNYWTGPMADPRLFRISCYAHGRDYHRIIGERLHALSAELPAILPGSSFLTYCDTGPVSEKVWAEAAGVGWQGKHSNLLTRDFSGWLFLAVLLTDAILDYDRPATNHCGSCTRCLEACPTQAITEPYVVDSRRCISYLTIEHRGVIARELRPGMGSWVYGCDICQEVCPWDRFRRSSDEEAFQPSGNRAAWVPEEALEWSLDEFDRRFAESPIRRAKQPGLLRNLVIAMGNRRDPQYGPPLARALDHEEALVRGHAAWALGRSPWDRAPDRLRQRLVLETDPWVCEEIRAALQRESGG